MAMHEERRLFMSRLEHDRNMRLTSEASAAIVLQAFFRGNSTRKRLQTGAKRAATYGHTDKCFDEEISTELLDLAQRAGLVPMQGVTLVPDSQNTKQGKLAGRQQQRQEQYVARIIQTAARRHIAVRRRCLHFRGALTINAGQERPALALYESRGHQAKICVFNTTL